MWESLKLKDLKIGKKLGKGSFGDVYEAQVNGHDGIFALKILDKSKYKRNPKGYKYLENEIAILKNTAHENIVKLYSSDIETFLFRYLVTEYCNGGDLEQCLEYYKSTKKRPFTEEEVQHIMRQIVSAIKYLHVEKKIIHRDLKLTNILLHYDNEIDRIQKNILKSKVKIIDFGFARYINEELANSTLGSPLFMDPRILFKMGKVTDNELKYEEKADIYSLGVICYLLLTGNMLFDVTTMQDLLKETDKAVYKISVNLSKETISFLNYMLKYDPKKRLDIESLSKHNFIIKNVKKFIKIDKNKVGNNLKGSKLVFNMKESTIQYLNDDESDKSGPVEVDERTKKLIDTLNGISIKIKDIKEFQQNIKIKKEEPKLDKDIEKLIFDSIDIINNDEIYLEPKITPFIPGIEPDLLLINE